MVATGRWWCLTPAVPLLPVNVCAATPSQNGPVESDPWRWCGEYGRPATLVAFRASAWGKCNRGVLLAVWEFVVTHGKNDDALNILKNSNGRLPSVIYLGAKVEAMVCWQKHTTCCYK